MIKKPLAFLPVALCGGLVGTRHPFSVLAALRQQDFLPFLETQDDESAGLRGLILFCPFLEKTRKLFFPVGVSVIKECNQPN